MSVDVTSIVLALLAAVLGTGGGAFFTWKWQARKARAEAGREEASAAKELQDVYQQLVADVKTDRDEQKAYIRELKDDRQHLREESDRQRQRQQETDENVRKLEREVARNGRMVESMRPFLCADLQCKGRKGMAMARADVEQSEVESL